MEIISSTWPYFLDLHKNENYMDTKTNHKNILTIKLREAGTQMLVRVAL